jgi:hypothetical protein
VQVRRLPQKIGDRRRSSQNPNPPPNAGIPLTRATVILDTLHPVHEGRAFRWRADKQKTVEVVDYGRTNEGEAA